MNLCRTIVYWNNHMKHIRMMEYYHQVMIEAENLQTSRSKSFQPVPRDTRNMKECFFYKTVVVIPRPERSKSFMNFLLHRLVTDCRWCHSFVRSSFELEINSRMRRLQQPQISKLIASVLQKWDFLLNNFRPKPYSKTLIIVWEPAIPVKSQILPMWLPLKLDNFRNEFIHLLNVLNLSDNLVAFS